MTSTNNTTIMQILKDAGVRISHQRIAILHYLMEHRTHPTVDDIYTALHPIYPSLSRTTIYNTLRLLVENGTVSAIDINPNSTHYDADNTPHAHFLCKKCGRIFDIPITCSPNGVPAGFVTNSISIYYRGFCMNCAENNQ